ncbi:MULTISPECIES: helix-turn-helix transcriptional regulator [Bacillus]|uniref:helix-turn-helix transcriptional regulator n=1 Tax=Bacillus TaxID=1386 RepID=UPI000BEC5B8B|nr:MULTISPECIES: helix-turn-helix transcriptional regulator [Bacillus]PEF57703.1 transcriptional regulator [Bacillus cereus]MCC2499137.1 helix-turn-helix transcriptional regulator [Bacillus paranthracis]MDA1572653.1 helix-turn-helix transcriptional regulator [Bacillus cereus group sp. TH242-3LC]MDA1775710.1 helix-turn-helix transcriptional regulator [Bacillus cereus group sp. BY9-3LC]MDF9577752.1 helix-turn-helix transcriptional regulator [Bacillus paranthracis]
MKFKCRLRIIFAEREIKQKEFAKLVGLSQSTLSTLVNGANLPTFTTAFRIAKELNIHIEDIWIEDDK